MLINARRDRVRLTHACYRKLDISYPKYRKAVEKLLNGMFLDDLPEGDITTDLFPKYKNKIISAKITAKTNAVISGMEELRKYFSVKHPFFKGIIRLSILKKDGSKVVKGQVPAIMRGAASDLLKAERTALNFLQRMSGIATFTSKYVTAVHGRVLITPTRKTFWGLIDKKACLDGGGGSHRLNLSDATLIKDNHISLCGGVGPVFNALIKPGKKGGFVEIEVKSEAEARDVIARYAKSRKKAKIKWPLYIMFDNCQPSTVGKIIGEVKKTGL
jgi:nicotinate-nucleotide pyrophosphorylase (carboxylating)